jgi:hypothetical protein
MNESFLHYLWQFQYFDKNNLRSTQDELITVVKTGHQNFNSGPDFANAKVRISDIEWIGSVEVHVKSSDWYAHHHEKDAAYDNVVLHVVWDDDRPVLRPDHTPIPTLQLKDRIQDSVFNEYRRLVNSPSAVACEKSFPAVKGIVKLAMIDKALVQRLENKAKLVVDLLTHNNGDWEETCYQLLARNFGFKVNAEPFFQLAKLIPYKTILKQPSLLKIEALVFGQAGMLQTKTKDEYITALFTAYQALAQKYNLRLTQMPPSQWRFLRLRPANFPTVRLAQFAAMLFETKNIFSQLIVEGHYISALQILSAAQSEYWNTHYRFGKKAKGIVPDIGEASVQNIIINTVAPLMVAYGRQKDEQRFVDKAIHILQQLPGEQNKITRLWRDLGLKAENAADSQGLIELYNNFCQRRQCLNCTVGNSILKPK